MQNKTQIKMRIYVKVLKGSECEVTVAGGADVIDIKRQLQSQVSIPVDQQKLVYQGKPLADDKPISHYKITDGSKLFLLLKKPGTGLTPATSSNPSTPFRSATTTPSTPFRPSLSIPLSPEPEEAFEVDTTSGFYGKLFTFLKRHFTEKDALKVLKEFKKDTDRRISNMSLDDIERLAARKLKQTRGFNHSPRT